MTAGQLDLDLDVPAGVDRPGGRLEPGCRVTQDLTPGRALHRRLYGVHRVLSVGPVNARLREYGSGQQRTWPVEDLRVVLSAADRTRIEADR